MTERESVRRWISSRMRGAATGDSRRAGISNHQRSPPGGDHAGCRHDAQRTGCLAGVAGERAGCQGLRQGDLSTGIRLSVAQRCVKAMLSGQGVCHAPSACHSEDGRRLCGGSCWLTWVSGRRRRARDPGAGMQPLLPYRNVSGCRTVRTPAGHPYSRRHGTHRRGEHRGFSCDGRGKDDRQETTSSARLPASLRRSCWNDSKRILRGDWHQTRTS